jgi:integrase
MTSQISHKFGRRIKAKKMRYTISFDCKTHHVRKDGTIPMLLRVSINGEHVYINLGKQIKETHYDKLNKSVKAGIHGYASLTGFIDRQKVKIDTIITDHEKRGEILSVQRLKEIYEKEGGKVKSISFYDFVEETIKRERELKEVSEKTLDNYDVYCVNLKKYRPKLSIHDINKIFLEEYRTYITEVLKQADNSAYHAMCFIRKYTKLLFDSGKISKYPFSEFVVGKPFEVEPEYLEPEELAALHDLYDSKELLQIVRKAKNKHTKYKEFPLGEKYQEVLRYYLGSCYSGLRHSDIKTLKTAEIKAGFIVKEMQKGRKGRKKTVRIPIRKRLLSLLQLKSQSGLAFENPVMESSQTNKYLLAVAKKAGINKHITFHSARHTFAINSLILGVKIEVVSDILGHSELTTTQRYARVVDKLREQEMDKWDKLAKQEFGTSESIVSCPSCENTIMKFEKNVIQLNKLPVVCPYCSVSFSYNLKENISELSMKLARAI